MGSKRVLMCLPVCAAMLCGHGASGAVPAPPGPPGPPPGALAGLPLPPPPGVAPGPQPDGPPAVIPAHASGPALLNGVARLTGTVAAVHVSCQVGGSVTVSARVLGAGRLATARFACHHGQATLRIPLPAAKARSIARLGSVIAEVAFGAGNRMLSRTSILIQAGGTLPRPWSDGGLQCGPSATLLAPNFRVTPPTTIDVRPWLAWFTPEHGWRWLGTRGPNASQWYRVTATPGGVAEWRTASGGVRRWQWGPVVVPPGVGISVVGVFEVVYWYSRPVYVWGSAPSSSGTMRCGYP